MTKELYEKMEAGYYDKIVNSSNPVQKYWNIGRFNKIIGKLNLNKNTKILDLGCGPGTFFSLVKGDYALAVGVDFDEKQINFAKNKFRSRKIRWICGDVTKMHIKEKFDYIVCTEVIEHIMPNECPALLKAMKHLLSKDGTVIFTTPNYKSLWPVVEWFVNRIGKVDYSVQHVNKLDIEKLTDLLKRNGFKVKKIETFYILSPFLVIFSVKLSRAMQKIEESLFPRFGSIMIAEAKHG